MSMKKWTDEELISTRDNLEAWENRSKNSGAGSKLWLLTALLGAFAISTGVAFIFLDGVDVMSIILIIMGTVTCFSWYRSEKQRKDNIGFLDEIRKEIKSRKLKDTANQKDKVSGSIEAIKADADNKKELSVAGTQTTDKN
ncbi:MAG: hypothetical protein JSR71_09000 [Proteobacteria bacterium]|nr:hypothetical protein [Pseudomonadota bacterium]